MIELGGFDLACPRCRTNLRTTALEGVTVLVCAGCKGTLVGQPGLATLLQAMSGPLLATCNPDRALEKVPDPGPGLRCPNCEDEMAHDDYCAAGLVFFDRCDICAFIWLDGGELEPDCLRRVPVRPAERARGAGVGSAAAAAALANSSKRSRADVTVGAC